MNRLTLTSFFWMSVLACLLISPLYASLPGKMKKAKSTRNIYNPKLSPVIVSSYYHSPTYNLPPGDALFEYIGKSMSDAKIQGLINAAFTTDYVLSAEQGRVNYTWKDEGFTLKFDENNKLYQIRFLNKQLANGVYYSAYKSSLPLELRWDMSRNAIENKIGTAISTHGGDNSNIYSTYNVNGGYMCIITYDTKTAAEYNVMADDIIIMQYNQNVTATRPTTVESPAQQSNTTDPATIQNGNNSNIVHAPGSAPKPEISPKNMPDNPSVPPVTPAPAVPATNEPQKVTIDNVPAPVFYNGSITGNKLFTLLDKSQTDPQMTAIIQDMGSNVEVMRFDGTYQFNSIEKGMILVFGNQAKLLSITLMNNKVFLERTFVKYKGLLPGNINFNSTRQQTEQTLGPPVEVSYTDGEDYWQSFPMENGAYNMIVTYNTKQKDNMLATIGDVRLVKAR